MNDSRAEGSARRRPPALGRVLEEEGAQALVRRWGRPQVADALREGLDDLRSALREGRRVETSEAEVVAAAAARLEAAHALRPKAVFNLTGTVLHTNLGRALLAEPALAAVAAVAASGAALEFDLESGGRGDRDDHVEEWLTRLTGAEAGTIVNNNAAAVLLILNTLALDREVLVSRGELVEIGGSFRMPEIMARAGVRLREVGTTNRTRVADYAGAIGAEAAMIMKVHASNYRIEGFTEAPPEPDLAALARERSLPFAVDLGAGALVDLERWGLPHEPTPRETLANGADLVAFSGDKLLGGPQAGLIVGRRDLVAALKRNPLKRALRCDKMTIAALSATLPLYADPDRLPERLPTLRLLLRAENGIRAQAEQLAPAVEAALHAVAEVEVVACRSQIGSGALPADLLPSSGLALRPRRRRPSAQDLATALRRLPTPVIGRIERGAVILDLRCLEDEAGFAAQLPALAAQVGGAA